MLNSPKSHGARVSKKKKTKKNTAVYILAKLLHHKQWNLKLLRDYSVLGGSGVGGGKVEGAIELNHNITITRFIFLILVYKDQG